MNQELELNPALHQSLLVTFVGTRSYTTVMELANKRHLIDFLKRPQFKRFLLYAIILLSTCVSLFFVAAVAYIVIYVIYIPNASIYSQVDLDFSFTKPGAFAVANIASIPFSPSVNYNVYLQLDLPRTPHNQQLGNFMVRSTITDDLEPFSEAVRFKPSINHWPLTSDQKYMFDGMGVQSTKTRMAIMPYRSQLVEWADTLVFLPLYLLNLKSQHSVVNIPFYELAKPVPALKYIVLELDRVVDINSAQLVWTVKWRGIRYLMHNYRLFMFVIGTWSFWLVETVVMAAVAYYVITQYGRGAADSDVMVAFNSRESSNYVTPETPEDASPSPHSLVLDDSFAEMARWTGLKDSADIASLPTPFTQTDEGPTDVDKLEDRNNLEDSEVQESSADAVDAVENLHGTEEPESPRAPLTPEPTPGPEEK